MINYQSQKQLRLFETPFEQHLDANNRWVQLADKLPWDDLVKIYNKKLRADFGAPSIDGRMIIATLIIKHKLNLSDREVIEMIRENIYMQYFVGLSSFTTKEIFHHTEFVHIRKRLQVADFNEMTEELMREAGILQSFEKSEQNDNESSQNRDGDFPNRLEQTQTTEDEQTTSQQNIEQAIPHLQDEQQQYSEQNPDKEQLDNAGVMQLDATVADQKIKYPNDVDLLNTGRQETDRLIDILCGQYQLRRARTYRRIARMQYLNFAKKKNKAAKQIRKARKQQLQFLKRNLKRLDEIIEQVQQHTGSLRLPFEHRDLRILWAIRLLYDQQLQMHNANTNRLDDRIVSLYQPYVRPIMRGKAKHKVEFGSKNGISLQYGYALLEKLSWDAYNECNDLQPAADNYKRRHGYYPECIVADSIYHTKANKKFCEDNHIQLVGKRLSKRALSKMSSKEKKEYRKLHNSRNQVEGKFGQGKNGYGLNEIKAKYANTSASWIAAVYFVMNILVFAGSSFCHFFYWLYNALQAMTLKRKIPQPINDQS
ncbi:MAG TPA: IS5 family transposase, partial [Parafilimonas sp.]|nr:IS5 family transposase [Parafilimonas sp.]